MNKNLSSEYGQIQIHRKVIFQAAELAAKEVKGVKKVGAECCGLFGKMSSLFREAGTKILLNDGKEMKLSLPVVVDYNTNAVEVAYEIQKKVTARLLETLNIDALSVDVKIKKIEGR